MSFHPPLITGPIPAESNPPINPQYFQPSRFQIAALSLGISTTVTTTVNHNYVVGQQIRLLVPKANGTFQIKEQSGYVTSIPSPTQVVVNINSVGFTAFVASGPSSLNVPQIIAIGEINTGTINSSGRTNTGTFIPGSFINISPL